VKVDEIDQSDDADVNDQSDLPGGNSEKSDEENPGGDLSNEALDEPYETEQGNQENSAGDFLESSQIEFSALETPTLEDSLVSPSSISPKNQDLLLDEAVYTINIGLPAGQTAQAYIYIYTWNGAADVMVTRLNLGLVSAGEHTFNWNGRYGRYPEFDGLGYDFVTDGIYTYKVRLTNAADSSKTKIYDGNGYVLVDNTAPKSTLDSNVILVDDSVDINYTVNDWGGSGALSIALWESSPSSGYTNYSQVQLINPSGNSGIFHYSPAGGDGVYSYLSIATDNVGNVEEFKYMKIDQFKNAGFESGDLSNWNATGFSSVIGADEYTNPYEGNFMVRLGLTDCKFLDIQSEVTQTFTVTEPYLNFAYIAFSLAMSSPDGLIDEYGYILIKAVQIESGEEIIAYVALNAPVKFYNTTMNIWSSGWQVVGIDLSSYIGQEVTVTFRQLSTGYIPAPPTWVYFDTVNRPVQNLWTVPAVEEQGEVLGESTGPVATLARTGQSIQSIQLFSVVVFSMLFVVLRKKFLNGRLLKR
jgi:hypothetical protein